MTLADIKHAAKRLQRSSIAPLGGTCAPLTHHQALDKVAQLHGFRHYHEARQRLKSAETADLAHCSPISAASSTFNLDESLTDGSWPIGEALAIVGEPGAGKMLAAQELLLSELARGTRVRILDSGGRFQKFAQLLSAPCFIDASSPDFLEAWSSDIPLAVLEVESPRFFSFNALAELPGSALFVCAETQLFRSKYKRLGTRELLIARDEGELPWATHPSRASEKPGCRLLWAQ